MKSRAWTKFGYLFFTAVLGCGILAAQEPKTFNVPVPPPPDGEEDVVMFWNDADLDEDGGPEMAWFGTEPDVIQVEPGMEMGAGPMHHYSAGRRVMIHGEGRPWLGVMLSDLDAEKASGANGVLVKDVRPESPAAKAGIAKDDVITEFAGEKIRSAEQLRRLVRETPPGRSVPLVVNRAGKTQSLSAKLEARHQGPMAMGGMGSIPAGPEPFTMPLPPGGPMPRHEGRNFKYFVQRGARLGISGDDLTPQLAEYFGVKQGKGVLVREVIVGSAAEKAGLKAGDVVVAVDGTEIASVGKLRRALAGDKPDAEKRKVSLTIVRDKREQTLSVELDSPDKGMPKPAMRAEIEIDTDRVVEMADEAAAAAQQIALAWQERAKTFQSEWKDQLQKEMEQLRKELPNLRNEIEQQRIKVKAQLERI